MLQPLQWPRVRARTKCSLFAAALFVTACSDWNTPPDTDTTPPGGPQEGLAARYPGDVGIENDPAVVFIENFEELAMSDVLTRWEQSRTSTMSLVSDHPLASSGVQSLRSNGSGDLYRRLLSPTGQGYDQLYLRFYTKFDPSCYEVHHFVGLGGHNPSTSYPWPRAGERPEGWERWSSWIEPHGTRWAWDFYTYWMHMRTNPDGRFWGNSFSGRPSPYPVTKGQWISVELMVKMNNPVTAYNGEQAFWIDGELKTHLRTGYPTGNWVWDGFDPDASGQPFEGIRWRTTTDLTINYLWLEHYVDTDPSCKAWFDDVVVATEYIGPIVVP